MEYVPNHACPRILVVDDDEVDRIALSRGLRRAEFGCHLEFAHDGADALERVQSRSSEPLDLILLDINMPRMDGFAFLDALHADATLPKPVTFILTTSDDDQDVDRAYQRGVAGYLVKGRLGSNYSSLASLLQHYCDAVVLPAPYRSVNLGSKKRAAQ